LSRSISSFVNHAFVSLIWALNFVCHAVSFPKCCQLGFPYGLPTSRRFLHIMWPNNSNVTSLVEADITVDCQQLIGRDISRSGTNGTAIAWQHWEWWSMPVLKWEDRTERNSVATSTLPKQLSSDEFRMNYGQIMREDMDYQYRRNTNKLYFLIESIILYCSIQRNFHQSRINDAHCYTPSAPNFSWIINH